jgi:hypothetical protein
MQAEIREEGIFVDDDGIGGVGQGRAGGKRRRGALCVASVRDSASLYDLHQYSEKTENSKDSKE